ncbi:hypothetical protein Mal48_44070 [Thalassoglobus polymorphus]|uniref:Uncharacterized protein n=1 Tax=Thalassoglobus polymorphus TaxID=2527994 RepID=A0A517QU33_9PLAN|nr:hypothetical protein Mal48_44070 [Thalassoglobus polymorphus]
MSHNRMDLEHLSNWCSDSASWRAAILLEKRVPHGQTHGHAIEQTALELILILETALSSFEESDCSRGFRTVSNKFDQI